MTNTAYISIDIFILIFSSIGILTSVGILILIFYHRELHAFRPKEFSSQTFGSGRKITEISDRTESHIRYSARAEILVSHTYLSVIFICIILFDMYAHNLYGDLHSNVSFNSEWCYGRAYILHVGLATLYHSYIVQALFRSFHVIKSKRLQSVQFMFRLVLIQ
jgi:hypothetical protein